ncbi:hypothetical protein ACFL9U_00585 [Thermodesulfobacteriota bacterium]
MKGRPESLPFLIEEEITKILGSKIAPLSREQPDRNQPAFSITTIGLTRDGIPDKAGTEGDLKGDLENKKDLNRWAKNLTS